MNPYLEAFQEVPDSFKAHSWSGQRYKLTEEYAYAVPSEAALDRLSQFNSIIEIGAGRGYWASQIDTSIESYDIEPYEDSWTEIGIIEPDNMPMMVYESPAECLFLCWPPYGSPMAYDALNAFTGEWVAYVGEGLGGCTADDSFHHALDKQFELNEVVGIPQWKGLHDRLEIWRRI